MKVTSTQQLNVWVVIPAYNEEDKVGSLVRDIRRLGFSVLVIDDGSTDGTYEVARREADVVLKNERNYGKGVALRRGITYLLERANPDYIITMDADYQHSPDDIEKFLDCARAGKHFVIGDRMHNPEGMPFVRKGTNRFMSWLISLMVGQKIPDTQCGFRLIKRDVLESIDMRSDKFEVESEIIIEAARRKFAIESIPIRSIYHKHHRSNIHPFFDTLRFIKFILSRKR